MVIIFFYYYFFGGGGDIYIAAILRSGVVLAEVYSELR
jgi:hypothetical protein